MEVQDILPLDSKPKTAVTYLLHIPAQLDETWKRPTNQLQDSLGPPGTKLDILSPSVKLRPNEVIVCQSWL